jgi:hypothetical protein
MMRSGLFLCFGVLGAFRPMEKPTCSDYALAAVALLLQVRTAFATLHRFTGFSRNR